MNAYAALEAHYGRLGRLNDALEILFWDMATMMPKGGAEGRGETLSTMKVLHHELSADPSLAALLDEAGGQDLDAWQRANVREMKRAYAHATAVPGDLVEAERLLQRPYRFSGQVVQGRGLGRQLGWPTANLAVDGRKCLPAEGVYAARARLLDADADRAAAEGPAEPGWMAAVMNLGPQPTVDPSAPSAVEVHLLDRRLELVGRCLQVEPLALLRQQQRFDGLAALRAQIGRDADQARALAGGVGVAEAPADEGGDAAQQQNS